MTLRTGDEIVGLRDEYREGTHGSVGPADSILGLINAFYGGTHGSISGNVLVNALTIGDAPPNYKNQGYYVAGSAFEEWISVGLPSTFPPSAHTLTDIQHVVLAT